jgi:hypothetical protein
MTKVNYTQIPTFAIYDSRLTQKAFRLFCFLRMMDEQKEIGLGFDKIRQSTGLSFADIYKATEQLGKLGYLASVEIDE